MGWSIGYDAHWHRDIGYGVPARCDHPGCMAAIDRGLAHVCGGEPYGGERGCGLFFCGEHLVMSSRLPQLCSRCKRSAEPFEPTPDVPQWMQWKLDEGSWQRWREENPDEVLKLKAALAVPDV